MTPSPSTAVMPPAMTSHITLSVGTPVNTLDSREPIDPEASRPQTRSKIPTVRRIAPLSLVIESSFQVKTLLAPQHIAREESRGECSDAIQDWLPIPGEE